LNPKTSVPTRKMLGLYVCIDLTSKRPYQLVSMTLTLAVIFSTNCNQRKLFELFDCWT